MKGADVRSALAELDRLAAPTEPVDSFNVMALWKRMGERRSDHASRLAAWHQALHDSKHAARDPHTREVLYGVFKAWGASMMDEGGHLDGGHIVLVSYLDAALEVA